MGDIGCYTLGAVPPLNAIDSVLCMGASVGMAIGLDKADDKAYKNTVAVIGDSTFIHSGITGLIDAVYNRANVTVIIVDNSTTGMTGHQNHPATGKNIKNEPTSRLSLENVCLSVGADRVSVVDPYDLDLFKETVKSCLSEKGVKVIIARRPCALLTKRLYNGCEITAACRNCKACLKLGCPAIINGENGVKIDLSLCTECGLCQKVCRFGAIKTREE
jgi:indolepyruvate ferredoxin oxidoreductase alpha subunit